MALPPYTPLPCHVHTGKPSSNVQAYRDNKRDETFAFYPYQNEGLYVEDFLTIIKCVHHVRLVV